MVRVVHLIAPVAFGGGESLLVSLLEAAPKSLDQSVVMIGRSQQLMDALRGIDVSCITLTGNVEVSERPKARRLVRLPRELLGVPRLRRYLREHRVDVLHAHGFPPSLLGAVTPRHCAAVYTHHYERMPPGAQEHFALRAVFSRYKLLTAPSGPLTSDMNRFFPTLARPFITVPNCISKGFFLPAPDLGWKHRLGIGPRAPLLVAVGRLVSVKGHFALIEAMSAAKGPNASSAHLAIAGAGPEEARLRTLIETRGLGGRVHLLGALTRDQVRALLQEATAVAHPSSSEGMSLAALEALAAGQPVLALDIPSMREVLGPAGVLVPPVDLPNGIERVLGSADGLRLVARARAEGHRPERIASLWAELYTTLE